MAQVLLYKHSVLNSLLFNRLSQLKSLIPPSLTIAALEKEARDGSGSVMTSLDHGRNLRSSSDRSVSMQSRASSDDELIVLRKDDLNTLLTAKPTVLIGRELVSSSSKWLCGRSFPSTYSWFILFQEYLVVEYLVFRTRTRVFKPFAPSTLFA